MPTVKGREQVAAYFAAAPKKVEGLLRGAGRVGVKVIADEARLRVTSDEVRAAIKEKVTVKDLVVTAKVLVKGEGAYIAPWLEYGTDPHLISVDESQRRGLSVSRINRIAKTEGVSHSLVIGGRFVGSTVLHPGARPHPFLRVSLDLKQRDAVAAMQTYINTRGKRLGLASEGDGS